MTQNAGLSTFRFARTASTGSRLVLGVEAFLPLFELAVRVVALTERKPSYCSVA